MNTTPRVPLQFEYWKRFLASELFQKNLYETFSKAKSNVVTLFMNFLKKKRKRNVVFIMLCLFSLLTAWCTLVTLPYVWSVEMFFEIKIKTSNTLCRWCCSIDRSQSFLQSFLWDGIYLCLIQSNTIEWKPTVCPLWCWLCVRLR